MIQKYYPALGEPQGPNGAKAPQDGPRRPQEAPKRPSEAPKKLPRGFQEAPKRPHNDWTVMPACDLKKHSRRVIKTYYPALGEPRRSATQVKLVTAAPVIRAGAGREEGDGRRKRREGGSGREG